jgi:hypothetical protein
MFAIGGFGGFGAGGGAETTVKVREGRAWRRPLETPSHRSIGREWEWE